MTSPKVGRAPGGRQVPSPPTERVVAVMKLLAAEPRRALSLTDIARTLDISRATAHAILATLAEHRWVVRDAQTHGYHQGPAFAAMARTADDRPFHGVLHDLHRATGVQVFLARRESASIVVLDSVGDTMTESPARAGFQLPLVAPFGRDYMAWAGDRERTAWLEAISSPSNQLAQRLSDVLEEVRRRGFVIERLSREYVRVYTALRALGGDGQPDAITARLAGAFADLTLVDYLPGELTGRRLHPIATVSAPIKERIGAVVMSVSAAPFAELTKSAVEKLGEQVQSAAAQIEATLT